MARGTDPGAPAARSFGSVSRTATRPAYEDFITGICDQRLRCVGTRPVGVAVAHDGALLIGGQQRHHLAHYPLSVGWFGSMVRERPAAKSRPQSLKPLPTRATAPAYCATSVHFVGRSNQAFPHFCVSRADNRQIRSLPRANQTMPVAELRLNACHQAPGSRSLASGFPDQRPACFFHDNTRMFASICHITDNCPDLAERAPYFAELVTSSCRARASVCAVTGTNETSEPLILFGRRPNMARVPQQ